LNPNNFSRVQRMWLQRQQLLPELRILHGRLWLILCTNPRHLWVRIRMLYTR